VKICWIIHSLVGPRWRELAGISCSSQSVLIIINIKFFELVFIFLFNILLNLSFVYILKRFYYLITKFGKRSSFSIGNVAR
jgi:hypothetical protein